jgi:hypothetical protein
VGRRPPASRAEAGRHRLRLSQVAFPPHPPGRKCTHLMRHPRAGSPRSRGGAEWPRAQGARRSMSQPPSGRRR